MMTQQYTELYSFLLNNHFVSNEYFESYIDLIEANTDTPYQKYKTQKHHIIPKYILKKLGLKDVSDKKQLSITVNLLYKDHILAHYLLCKCCNDEVYLYGLLCAFCYLYFGKNSEIPNTKIIKYPDEQLQLDDLQELYELNSKLKSKFVSEQRKGKKGKPLSQETREKLRQINLGRHHTEEFKRKMGRPHTDEWKKQNSLNMRGRIHITNGVKNKRIKKEDLEFFQQQGWVVGYTASQNQIKKNQDPEKRRKASDTLKGHTLSIEARAKISKKISERMSDPEVKAYLASLNKGKHWYNNGIIEHMYYEKDVPEGYVLGRLKNVK